jgi:hypothetical protein
MSFLEQSLGDMSREELVRLIKQVVHQEVPAIPAALLALDDEDQPIIAPPVSTDGQLLQYGSSTGSWDSADPTTAIIGSDGTAPGSSPTPTVRGNIGSLVVQWTPVSNNDLVIYEVHLSTSSGFTPSGATKVGETPGALAFIRKDAAGAALAYGTDYYVKIVARDDDGSASASAEAGPTQLDPAGTDDILANAITAEKLATVLSLASSMVAGTPGSTRVETGYGIDASGDLDPSFIGIRAYDGSNKLTLKVDAASGTSLFRGKVYFGSKTPDDIGNSRLTTNDMIQIAEQPGGSWQTPTLEQTASGQGNSGTTGSATWDSATTSGNELLMVVAAWLGSGAPTFTTPAGWTQVNNSTFDGGNGRRAIYRKSTTGESGTQSITFSAAPFVWNVQLFEYSGVQNVEDATNNTNAGSASTVGSGTTGSAMTQQGLVFAALTIEGNYSDLIDPNLSSPSSGYSQAGFVSARHGLLSGTELSTYVYTKVASSGTQVCQATGTNVDQWGGGIVTLKAKAVAVESAEANSVRLYGKDVSGKTRVHAIDEGGTEGAVVLGKAGETWRLELVTVAIDIASAAAHSGGSNNVSITGLATNDYAFFIGTDITAGAGRDHIFWSNPLCTVAGQITLQWYNASAGVSDPASANFYFLVIHRS